MAISTLRASGIYPGTALEVAWALSEITEWSAAGIMLRVARIDDPKAALSFALNARADCLQKAGRDLCTQVIRVLEAATAA